MMFDDQPSFVVVSNGAECILLSKKFYLEHATLAMLSKLGREVCRKSYFLFLPKVDYA